MKILELGSYIAPAYAGMVLAEQGHHVEKWLHPDKLDPTLELNHGRELWAWINEGKTLAKHDIPGMLHEKLHHDPPDVVIENIRDVTWVRWNLSPDRLAREHGIRWVALRSEVEGNGTAPTGWMSFDVIAQARSTLTLAPWVPYYLGDTAAGLWMAYKAVVQPNPGFYAIGHATCLRKLVEGELVVTPPRGRNGNPWDRDVYKATECHAIVDYRGHRIVEPIRDDDWQRNHLWHENGRCIV